MAKLSKKKKALAAKIEPGKTYSVAEAVALLSEFATGKFKESLDVSINLGIDARKSDQAVRGSTVLPAGTGKTVRVAVFAQGENAEKAKAAGADVVGFDDLAESIQAGNLDFDVVIATPDAMRVVGKLGTVLGPRGLMPNPKVGTVTPSLNNDHKISLTRDKDQEVYWRKLTPLECERLQTVPDNYTNHVSNTQRYKMLGNGWTIEVIAHILKNMEIV